MAAFGDGVAFGVRADGAVEAWPIEQGGLPTYPSYGLDAGRLARLRQVVSAEDSEGCDLLQPQVRDLDPADWRLIGVASDGLSAFRAGGAVVPVAEVLAHVTDVRVPAGRFIERSSTFFLRRTCPRLGWTPGDDYSVGALWLGGSP